MPMDKNQKKSSKKKVQMKGPKFKKQTRKSSVTIGVRG